MQDTLRIVHAVFNFDSNTHLVLASSRSFFNKMGNCFTTATTITTTTATTAAAFTSKKSTAEIAPYDCVVKVNKPTPSVRLCGSPNSILTAYVRFALLYKSISPRFIPCDNPIFETEVPTVLRVGSESVSGSRQTLLDFVESKFPEPSLNNIGDADDGDEVSPRVVRMMRMQHGSLRWHLARMVRWAEDLAKRKGKKAGDPTVGSPKMEFKKFASTYSQLLELLLEHAQMEERVVFPGLEKDDRGLCKAANEEHARDLPIMNGIKEDIKAIGVLDCGSPAYQEALRNLSVRLKSLQKHCKEHFEEEERDLLPLVEATELSTEQQKRTLAQCVSAMQGTHSRLFNFFLEGLTPEEAMQYLDLTTYAVIKNNLSPNFV